MRRKIELYINGMKADTSGQSFILFNYARESLDNPAVVKNSYSQSISLPGTATNDVIFGGLERLDHTQSQGASFRTLQKMPFKIFNELGEVLESGYVKLNTITKKGTSHTYEIALFGGLGGFFYNLMYNSEGEKMSLADLQFNLYGLVGGTNRTMRISKDTISAAWDVLAGLDSDDLFSLINFAPAYNGIPEGKFGADKAVCQPYGSGMGYPNLYNANGSYSAKQGANGAILVEMEKPHTEWEVQDLRSYLQRPVISIKKLMEALQLRANTGDYTFVLDPAWIDGNIWYDNGWMTLPLLDTTQSDPSQFEFGELLRGTASPAEYLIGFAKMFGLVFVTDSATNTITLMSRDRFYSDGSAVVDLTDRLDVDSVKVGVYPMDAKFYIWDAETVGEFCKEYESKYGRSFGSAWVNTGYDFNADQKKVLEGLPYKGAADALESSINFQVFGGNADDMGAYTNYLLKFALTEKVSWKLYGTDAEGRETSQDYEPSAGWLAPFRYSGDNTYNDFLPKVQLHAEEQKPEDGSGVLLFFEGMTPLPTFDVGGIGIASVDFHLSDDSDEMLLLNGGEPCWDVSVGGDNILPVSVLPSFRRWHFNSAGLNATFDFGDVRETATGEVFVSGKGLYPGFWEGYITDRYDEDTRVLTCKVDLKGMKVDDSLLRKFFYYDGCLWVLNKISNYSLTTYDLAECEFIKVQDKSNYNATQII